LYRRYAMGLDQLVMEGVNLSVRRPADYNPPAQSPVAKTSTWIKGMLHATSTVVANQRVVSSSPSPSPVAKTSAWAKDTPHTTSTVVANEPVNKKSDDHMWNERTDRIMRAMSVPEVLSAVRDGHQDFIPADAAFACHRLDNWAEHWKQRARTGQMGREALEKGEIESDEDVATFQLLIAAVAREASGMNAHEVSRSFLAYGRLATLAEIAKKGVDVDVAAVRALSDAAVNVVR
jgi:hypothetical protein